MQIMYVITHRPQSDYVRQMFVFQIKDARLFPGPLRIRTLGKEWEEMKVFMCCEQ